MTETGPVLQVVDISKDDLNTAEQLVKAASTLGFVMIEGSGFTQKDVDRIFELVSSFFFLTTFHRLDPIGFLFTNIKSFLKVQRIF